MGQKLQRYGGWAIITGASSGIGAEFARQIAAQGVSCILVARRENRLRSIAKELAQEHNVDVQYVVQDLASDDCADVLEEAIGDVEVGMLVNNAGFGDGGAFHTREEHRIAEMVKLNCLAPALLTRRFLPHMIERQKGAVITVASVLGLFPCPYEALYGATKAFDASFGEALYYELQGTGVDAITISPALTATEFLIAEGLPAHHVDRIYRGATPASRIASITLKALGRRPVVGPRDFHLASFGLRVLPRGWITRAVSIGMKRNLLTHER